MGRSPCCSDKGRLKKGPWSPEEDEILIDYIQKHGHGSWGALSKGSGLNRCGKSCRLRWTNYLRPDIKRGNFSQDEEQTIINLHSTLGNKWSQIAAHLPGRTDNEIKNFWNTHLRKKLFQMGIDPKTHKPIFDLNLLLNLSQSDATQLQFLQNLLQVINMSPLPNIEQNYPLGSNNLSPLDGLVNGTSTQYIIDAYKEETRFPSTRITSLPACFGGGFSPEVQNINIDNSLSTTIQRQTRLPALVSTTSEISTMFETLEKFTDDEANSNLLNDIIIE